MECFVGLERAINQRCCNRMMITAMCKSCHTSTLDEFALLSIWWRKGSASDIIVLCLLISWVLSAKWVALGPPHNMTGLWLLERWCWCIYCHTSELIYRKKHIETIGIINIKTENEQIVPFRPKDRGLAKTATPFSQRVRESDIAVLIWDLLVRIYDLIYWYFINSLICMYKFIIKRFGPQ